MGFPMCVPARSPTTCTRSMQQRGVGANPDRTIRPGLRTAFPDRETREGTLRSTTYGLFTHQRAPERQKRNVRSLKPYALYYAERRTTIR